ncbi:RNA polymerase sigma-70 factor (ECF subfamily) [Sphingobium jiangsuense]|uniref:RNA polymerase sigma-70 factor (ECF subfamily) n=2 Tax=Sphingobium jiangsuense TaxID=870476 RepID=A0A7W6BHA9_9SPHN|nr:sigma-70 family RNA polymerase sigma factor [Sphingobium jiangsuense]MBB3926990.1 RNA polymerase sigma-70 factor (ECF subfamily) [Sphingobium jiangsuense]
MSQLLPTDILEEMSSMRRYARSLTRDEQAADDVVQDALLKALEKRHLFRPDGSRRGWLLAIVHNIFISTRRREEARARRDTRFAGMLTDRLDPDQEHAATLHQVAQAFAALPEPYRAILHLVAVEGQSYQEAAAILDIPVGTVMSRLSRARAALRRAEGGAAEDGADGGNAADRGLRIVGGRDDD